MNEAKTYLEQGGSLQIHCNLQVSCVTNRNPSVLINLNYHLAVCSYKDFVFLCFNFEYFLRRTVIENFVWNISSMKLMNKCILNFLNKLNSK